MTRTQRGPCSDDVPGADKGSWFHALDLGPLGSYEVLLGGYW